MEDLSAYKEMMAKCSHCAFCQATCPVYLEDLLETHMPRARMDVIRGALVEEDLPVTKRVRQITDHCLLCGNCVRTCPAAVPVDDIVVAARHQLYEGKRKNMLKRAGLNNFMHRRGLTGVWKMASGFAKKRGILPSEMPDQAAHTFTRTHAGVHPAQGETRARVIYYVGCAANSLYTDTAEAVIAACTKNGIEVTVPEDILCCGIPALAEGDVINAREFARLNVEAISAKPADAIITDCTTCGMAFRHKIPKLLADDPLLEKANELGAKTFEVTDYLLTLGLTAQPGQVDARVTYHVPCHRSWTPTLDDAPRRLLEQIPGVAVSEMAEPEACCGAGGSFFADNREFSDSIRSKKLADISQTGAALAMTQCPACRTYIGGAQEGPAMVHPVQVLARSYENQGPAATVEAVEVFEPEEPVEETS